MDDGISIRFAGSGVMLVSKHEVLRIDFVDIYRPQLEFKLTNIYLFELVKTRSNNYNMYIHLCVCAHT